MLDLKTTLENKIKGQGKVAILGVGSELRGDDIAGLLAAGRLKNWSDKINNPLVKVFFGGTAPENLTSEIKKFQPKHLVIIDAADTGREAGAVTVIEPGDIGGASFGTHGLPLKIMVEYLNEYISGEIIIIGIQPKTIAFGAPPSKEVGQAAGNIADIIKETIYS